MKSRNWKKIWMLLLFAFIFVQIKPVEAKTMTFTITPKSEHYKGTLPSLNKGEYGLVRSYVDALSENGGGTLVLKKGTYKISNPIYISSNIKIILEDGVVIKKTVDSSMKAQTLFQFVERSRVDKMKSMIKESDSIEKQVNTIKKKNAKLLYKEYNGVKNAGIIGKGKVIIDLQNEYNAIGVVIGHTRNITIKGITFQNSNSNHFIELDASNGVTIEDCTFKTAKKSSGTNKEAINLDTPDLVTKGFNCFWSIQDKTPNKNIVIKNCKFMNLERGIGTHQFSNNKYHTNIKIQNCSFTNMSVPIFGLNWKNITITGNRMNTIRKLGNSYDGNSIFLAGASGINIQNNTIVAFEKPVIREKYNVSQHYYSDIYSTITQKEMEQINNNNIYK